ncbi:hypothetical protein GGH92_010800, partial [Coemansia sp. RSA 2673]
RVRLLKAAGVTDIVRTLDGALPGSPEHPVSIGQRIASHRPGSVYVDEELGSWDLEQCYAEMAAEMLEQTGGQMDALVLGVDTGNAATHLARALKAQQPKMQVVGVSDNVAYSMARRLIQAGIFAGPSAGASVAAARMYAVSASLQRGQRVVVIIGDSARNYGSTLLDDDWMLAHDLLDSRMLDELQKKQLDQYRAASIEDLQLPAAVTVSEQESMGAAINLMAENDFSQVPVTGSGRRLIGYLTLSAAQTMIDNGTATRSMPVRQFMLRFAGRATRKPSTEQHGSGGVAANTSICKQYWLITPETPLSELARFFETHSVAFVTDASR